MKAGKAIMLLAAIAMLSVILLPVLAEGYDCSAGKHQDVIVSQIPPTEFEDGEVTYRCELCGREYTDNLPRTGHSWSEWVTDKAPTCTQEGLRRRTCGFHGHHDETEAIPAVGHRYILSEAAATCVDDGIKTYTCSACGLSYTEPGELAKGHTYVEAVTEPPTCAASGERRFVCSACGDSYAEALPATGHSFGEWRTEAPGEGHDGRQYRECAVCGFIEEEKIAALPVSGPTKAGSIFNTADVIINSVNFGICIIFGILLAPLWLQLLWYKRKRREYDEKQQKIKQKRRMFERI